MVDPLNASAGHRLGQLVGDWFQDDFICPILRGVANDLSLYLDHRKRVRSAKPKSLTWLDSDGNNVDYDFVLELGGTDQVLGAPVAFLECFWRRGARHSKDKARDDSGKLVPMRSTYPTARFLGILAAGEFTAPARELVHSRSIDLFYIAKSKVIEAFAASNLVMEYQDRASESDKSALAEKFEKRFTADLRGAVSESLKTLISANVIDSYCAKVKAALSALPQELRISEELRSNPITFESVNAAAAFLNADLPPFSFPNEERKFQYEITYTDGFEFSRSNLRLAELKRLNEDMTALDVHMRKLSRR